MRAKGGSYGRDIWGRQSSGEEFMQTHGRREYRAMKGVNEARYSNYRRQGTEAACY